MPIASSTAGPFIPDCSQLSPETKTKFLLVAAKLALDEAESDAESQHRAERMTAEWTSYLPSWYKSLKVAVDLFKE